MSMPSGFPQVGIILYPVLENTEASLILSLYNFNRLWAQYLKPFNYKMNSMRDVNHIAKFNGQNFPLWKLGFWILLQQHELVNVVTGEEAIPVEVFYCNTNFKLYDTTVNNFVTNPFTECCRRKSHKC